MTVRLGVVVMQFLSVFLNIPLITLGFTGVTTSIWNRSLKAREIRHQRMREVVNKPTVDTK